MGRAFLAARGALEPLSRHELVARAARDAGVQVVAGHRDQLAGKIQERYGVAKDEAEKQLTAWQAKADESWFS